MISGWPIVVLSSLSCICCLIIIVASLTQPVLRRFPAPLIIFRAFCDLLFSAQFIVFTLLSSLLTSSDSSVPAACQWNSFLAQFAQAGSLGWFFVFSLNFYLSIADPFQRPESRMKKYHVYVWSVALATASVAASRAAYRPSLRICWTATESGVNYLNWIVFFLWVIAYWVISVVILGVCWLKLQRNGGLSTTLASRAESLRCSAIFVIVFTLYWLACVVIYIVIFYESANEAADLYETFAGALTSLGIVDFICWLYIQRQFLQRQLLYKLPWSSLSFVGVLRRNFTKKSSLQALEEWESPRNDISEALREEFVRYTIAGIAISTGKNKIPSENEEIQGQNNENSDQRQRNLEIKAIHGVFEFIEYFPLVFARLRSEVYRLSAENYVASMGYTPEFSKKSIRNITQHFSEGASGSFFYLSADKKFLVKTLTREEQEFFITILNSYFQHMKASRDQSLIIRFYGLYSIRMYGRTQYFAVMENILYTQGKNNKIHEIYDLKGSWINRNANRLASNTLKDSDFHRTILLNINSAVYLLQKAMEDVSFLRSLNIMDYSLLLGIHFCKVPTQQNQPHCQGFDQNNPLSTWNKRNNQISHRKSAQQPENNAQNYSLPINIKGNGSENNNKASSQRKSSENSEEEKNSMPTHSIAASSLLSSLSLSSPPELPASQAALNPISSSSRAHASPIHDFDMSLTSNYGHHKPNLLPPSASASNFSSLSNSSSFSMRAPFFQSYDGGLSAAVIEGPGIYFVGIIDMLQRWSWSKRLEAFFKTYFRLLNPYGLSARPPLPYAERFILMLRHHLEVPLCVLRDMPGASIQIIDHKEPNSARTQGGSEAERREHAHSYAQPHFQADTVQRENRRQRSSTIISNRNDDKSIHLSKNSMDILYLVSLDYKGLHLENYDSAAELIHCGCRFLIENYLKALEQQRKLLLRSKNALPESESIADQILAESEQVEASINPNNYQQNEENDEEEYNAGEISPSGTAINALNTSIEINEPLLNRQDREMQQDDWQRSN
jgi:1-phosphatidylinositol-4-phosphate 5-kinase